MQTLLKYTHLFLFCFLLAASSFAQKDQTEDDKEKDDVSSLYSGLRFRSIGPALMSGRIVDIVLHPQNENIWYVAAGSGGVWKTENYGYTWANVSDGFFETPSIGAIAIAPTDVNRIYVGTGSDGIRSNVIIGKGVYRSSDAGKTWSDVGLPNAGQVGSVIVHPEDADHLYVAALGSPFGKSSDRGVYKSIDGGTSWSQVLFLSDSVGAVDLEFHPADPNTIYASMWRAERKPWTIISGGMQVGGIYKTTDAGASWTKLTNGLPQGLIGKSDLAVSPAQPDLLWALVEAPQGEGGVFRSDDAGASFELVSTKKQLLDRPFYYCNIDVNPLNPNSIYINSTAYWHSVDGGKNWQRKQTPHGDNHDLWISPVDTLLQIQCNDGGANVTRDGGETWSSIHNQSTAELYQVNVDDQTPYWLYAGQQDNSTISVPSLPPYGAAGGPTAFWTAVGGCETGPAVPKPGNPDIVYSNCKGRFGTYNKKTGQEQQYYVGASNMYGHNPRDLKFRFQRVSPIHVSPHNPDLVYHTSQYVHRTIDDGKTWEIISPDLTAFTPETQVVSGYPITRDITGEEFYSTIYCIQESPAKAGIIWVGANDGPIHVTQDDGQNWKDVTPSTLAKGGRVQTIEASPHDEATAFAAILRYQFDDFRPYLYQTKDYGNTWELLSDPDSGFPQDHPVRVVRQDPINQNLLFAGTEFGMFISHDAGQSWSSFQQNLPVTPITDMKIHQGDLVLSTMGRGFWIMDDIVPLRANNANTGIAVATPHAMLRYRGTRGESIPKYPGAGVTLDYFLADAANEISLTIADENGNIVRTFLPSEKEDKKDDSEVSMSTGFRRVVSTGSLRRSQGGHRLLWDYRHQGSEDPMDTKYTGPRVAPGTYTVTLTVDGQSHVAPLSLEADPRLLENGVTVSDLLTQEKAALDVLALRKDVDDLIDQLQEKLKATSSEGTKSSVNDLLEKLVTKEGRYHQPMLKDQLRYLASMISRADHAPGSDAMERLEELERRYAELHKASKVTLVRP
ncbi:MAG: hypothetical protein KTR24_08300 [Saprospiraceae bacterium]|nr:hypothetical protein [Saprospiraceae bacterium]